MFEDLTLPAFTDAFTNVKSPVLEGHPLKRILVVEDDLTIQPMVERLLERLSPGIIVDWATTAEDALAAIEEKSAYGERRRYAYDDKSNLYYSVILSDIHLAGEKSGVDLVDDCFERGLAARFVLTSGSETSDLTLPFLPKPFRIETMKRLLSPYLEGRPSRSGAALATSNPDAPPSVLELVTDPRSAIAVRWILLLGSVYLFAFT